MPSNASSAASNADHREHLRRRAQHRADAVGAREVVSEGKRRRMREPAGERLIERREVPLGDVDMRRRAGPAVEEFVAAADREIGAVRIEPQFDRAARMREVPDDQRALGMRGCRHRRHVLDLGGAIVDVGQLDHRGVLVDRGGDLRRRHEAGVEPHHARDALDDVVVGGKIAALGEDGLAAGPHARGGDQQLEQIDRDRVGDGDLMRRGAEQRRELGPDAPRRLVPPSLVPRADQAGRPIPARSCARRAPRRPSARAPSELPSR